MGLFTDYILPVWRLRLYCMQVYDPNLD